MKDPVKFIVDLPKILRAKAEFVAPVEDVDFHTWVASVMTEEISSKMDFTRNQAVNVHVQRASICPHCEYSGCWPVHMTDDEQIVTGNCTISGADVYGRPFFAEVPMIGPQRMVECPECGASWNEDLEGQLHEPVARIAVGLE